MSDKCVVCSGRGYFAPAPLRVNRDCLCVAYPRSKYSIEMGEVLWWINENCLPEYCRLDDSPGDATHFQIVYNPTFVDENGKVRE